MLLEGGIHWAPWPTSWGDMMASQYDSLSGDVGFDAFAELSQYVPSIGIDAIMLINGETEAMECFWAKPNRNVKSLNFEAIECRYFDKFERLHNSSRRWLSAPKEERQSISWSDTEDESVRGYKIRKCMTLYLVSNPRADHPPVDTEFLRFKEYVYQRVVGRPIFSRECFKVSTVETKELFNRFFGPLFFRQSAENDCFRWPWQYVEYDRHGVDTVSLVFDTRISTLTYMHSSKKVEFIKFINKVKRIAAKRIVEFGGVFSMDTGDGVVGHFCNEISSLYQDSDATKGNMYVDSLNCSCAIIADLKEYFEIYKSKMDHLLDGLTPAIGLHCSDAHWVNIGGNCEAVGDNVIWANRTCAVAKGETVLYSQAVARGLEEAGEMANGLPRSKKVYRKLGDIPKKARWAGYQIKP